MTVKSSKEFEAMLLKKLNFNTFINKDYTLYKNEDRPELGYWVNYSREGYYDLEISDYISSKDFSLSSYEHELLMRFGLFYKENIKSQMKDINASYSAHSSFFVIEKDTKKQQVWEKGRRYRGIEITINERYFTEIIKPNFQKTIDFDLFVRNFIYTYLPVEIVNVIHQLQNMSKKNLLDSIYFESKILECISIFINEINKSSENAFANQINYGNINIGNDRIIKLTSSDIHAIEKAHDILLKNYQNPPSIKALSKMVFLNEQKLKAGFLKNYHMTIGESINHIRMTIAANLLSTTDLRVEDIARKVGYNYSANFSQVFKKTYGKTPLKFRKIK